MSLWDAVSGVFEGELHRTPRGAGGAPLTDLSRPGRRAQVLGHPPGRVGGHPLPGGICGFLPLWPWDPRQLAQPESVPDRVGTHGPARCPRPAGARSRGLCFLPACVVTRRPRNSRLPVPAGPAQGAVACPATLHRICRGRGWPRLSLHSRGRPRTPARLCPRVSAPTSVPHVAGPSSGFQATALHGLGGAPRQRLEERWGCGCGTGDRPFPLQPRPRACDGLARREVLGSGGRGGSAVLCPKYLSPPGISMRMVSPRGAAVPRSRHLPVSLCGLSTQPPTSARSLAASLTDYLSTCVAAFKLSTCLPDLTSTPLSVYPPTRVSFRVPVPLLSQKGLPAVS